MMYIGDIIILAMLSILLYRTIRIEKYARTADHIRLNNIVENARRNANKENEKASNVMGELRPQEEPNGEK